MSPADILAHLNALRDQPVVITCQVTEKDIVFISRNNTHDYRTVRGHRPILKQSIRYAVSGQLDGHFQSESGNDYLVLEYLGIAPQVIETMRGGVITRDPMPRIRVMHVPFSSIRTIRHANPVPAA